MCDICAALRAMRETLDYEDKNGNKWNILAVGEMGEDEEGQGKFQIQRDSFVWQDKWIDSDSIADSMSKLGADVHPKERSEDNWNYFQECIEQLGVQNNEPE